MYLYWLTILRTLEYDLEQNWHQKNSFATLQEKHWLVRVVLILHQDYKASIKYQKKESMLIEPRASLCLWKHNQRMRVLHGRALYCSEKF